MADPLANEPTKAAGPRRPLTVQEARERLRAAGEAGHDLSPLRSVSPIVLAGAALGAGLLFFKLPKAARTIMATGAGMLLKSKID